MTQLTIHNGGQPFAFQVTLDDICSDGKVASYATRINENWRKSVDSIIEVAQDCARAKKEFTSDEKAELLELLPFGPSMFSKLGAIGDNSRILEHRKLFPPSISTMYLAHRLEDDRFRTAIAEGALTPEVKRREFATWVAGETDKPTPAPPKKLAMPSALYCLYSDEPVPEAEHERLERAVIELAETEGVKAVVFTGETVMADIKTFWTKKVRPT